MLYIAGGHLCSGVEEERVIRTTLIEETTETEGWSLIPSWRATKTFREVEKQITLMKNEAILTPNYIQSINNGNFAHTPRDILLELIQEKNKRSDPTLYKLLNIAEESSTLGTTILESIQIVGRSIGSFLNEWIWGRRKPESSE